MADSGDSSPGRRQRAPTITIDTAVLSPSPEMVTETRDPHSSAPVPAFDNGDVSPSTTVDPGQRRSEVRSETSFDSSRPTSPHNVSSPISTRTPQNPGSTYLSVPHKSMSRQNSVDSSDLDRSAALSQADTAVSGDASQSSSMKKPSWGDSTNENIMNDEKALDPDQGREEDFLVEDNPFAFTPGQLNKMFNPKSLPAFYKLGGRQGIERGLRSDAKAGLSVDETTLADKVTFTEATHIPQEGALPADKEMGTLVTRVPSSSGSGDDKYFVDRKRVFKDNRLPEKKGKNIFELMWITYQDKVLIILSVAAVVSLAIGLYQTFGQTHAPGEPKVEWVEGVAIMAAIVIVVVVGSLNDFQKERQFAKLNKKKQDRLVRVVRSGKTMEISVYDILVGDVVHLEPGDLVPVDGILIQGFNVKCDESQATGESDVIKKQSADEVYEAIRSGASTKKMDPFIQSGARVMEGVGTFMCTSTGVYSTYGRTLMALNEDPEVTPLQSKLNVIATYIAKVGGAAALLLFLVLFIKFLAKLSRSTDTPAQKGQNFLEIFIVVVTIVVVAIPEGLPLAVTLALAFATTRMLKDNNLVRHLKACEVMGNATTICSDKTGTLTQNKMQVVAGTIGTTHRFGNGLTSTNTQRSSSDEDAPDSPVDTQADVSPTEFAAMLAPEVKGLLKDSIALNSTAFEGDIDGAMTFIGSKTETALLLFAKQHLGMGPVAEERGNSSTLHLIPFDSGRKCMGIVVSLPNGRARLYIKGASEIVLEKCTQMFRDPSQDMTLTSMTREHRSTVGKLIEHYARRSLRTIGIAYRDFEQWPLTPGEVKFEDLFHSMAFVGMVGIQDPLRPGVPEAVAQCQRAGVVVRMVTGDNRLTAQAIAQECGIMQPNSIVMEGPEFRNLSRSEQDAIIPRLHVLARSSPEDKRILVKRLKAKGDIVAVTGDGTNDAPALTTADVGFSMGIAGTEVAKQASAIILMDDNFASIVKALKWGRAVNDAVKKFLQFQLTVNVTAVVLTFVSAVSDTRESSVLTAVQLLWVNLIMDTLAALALATDPPQDSILNRKPERRDKFIISTTMWKMILGQAVYQLVITFLLYFGREAVLPETNREIIVDGKKVLPDDVIATLIFNTFVWMQIFNQWNNRRLDNHMNILEGITQNWIFPAINFIMIGVQILIIFVGGVAFKINKAPEGSNDPQGAVLWGVAILLGFLSIPIGMVIRLIPDSLLKSMIPESFIKRARKGVPGLTVSGEEDDEQFASPFAEVRDELEFLKRVKGGRLNNLKFVMRHPRETFKQVSRSPSHSRSNSVKLPQTPTNEEGSGSVAGVPATPESRKRSRSMRSRSNSALGAPTVMAGLVAAGVAAGWSPTVERRPSHSQGAASEAAETSAAPDNKDAAVVVVSDATDKK